MPLAPEAVASISLVLSRDKMQNGVSPSLICAQCGFPRMMGRYFLPHKHPADGTSCPVFVSGSLSCPSFFPLSHRNFITNSWTITGKQCDALGEVNFRNHKIMHVGIWLLGCFLRYLSPDCNCFTYFSNLLSKASFELTLGMRLPSN